jgi:hypothetical protein
MPIASSFFASAAKVRQVDHEGAADDLGAQAFDQPDPGLGRAAGGQKVVDQQHLFAGLHGVVMHLDHRLAVFQLVGLR